MDFQLNEDQVALQEGIRAFASGNYAFERIPEIEKQPLNREAWSELAEMGVFSLRLSEADGGLGLGMVEAVVVFQELGKCLAPGPLIWSQLAAGLVDGAATGEAIVGGLDLTRPGSEPLLLEYGNQLDTLLVLRPEGVFRVDPKALEMKPVGTPLDPLTPMQRVKALPQGDLLTPDVESLRTQGAALAAGLMLGIAEATLEYANDYAKTREQFDRPIGSFQAIKHMLADMYVRLGQVRCATYAAGATLDDPGAGNVVRAVSSAKVVAGEAAMKNARACIQIYGGMGYTWELPPHYYLKRTFVLEHAFGTIDEHAERVADSLAA
ncbi:MAG: acyl-CoA dehydrogenase family protein [Deltaproteobacteria bacterium]|nr:acyl-CoA dehydrogenase family protein [Deltaproteobacteria bacterium]MBW2393733.1 acyl-CoA dehydrogenase family protein [Deltaproteobacteria bacterium]